MSTAKYPGPITPLAIETQGLSKIFPRSAKSGKFWSRQGIELPAVSEVNLRVRSGELFGLLGPNGAGKTTLIKILATLIAPTSGKAQIFGFDLQQETAIKNLVGFVASDERSFYWRLSAEQNLEFFASLYGLPAREVPDRIHAALAQVDLANQAKVRFQELSSGMRQRLSIARALLNQPRLLFLDEPSKGLDRASAYQLHDLILGLQSSDITVFLTTHNLEEAEAVCERIAILHKGRIQAVGSLAELRQLLPSQQRYRIQVVGNLTTITENLSVALPEVQVEAPESKDAVQRTASAWREGVIDAQTREENLIWLTLEERDGNSRLQTAFDAIQRAGGSILAIENFPASLEKIYLQLTSQEHLLSQEQDLWNGKAEKPPEEPTKQAYKGNLWEVPPKNQRFALLLAFLKRDSRIEISYRFALALQFLQILFSVGIFYFISQAINPAAAPLLKEYGGDYFSFVLIGIALVSYFSVGLSSFSKRLRQAQTTGTLEAMLTTPASTTVILTASSAWDYLLVTFQVLVYLATGGIFLGVNLGSGNYPAALVILALAMLASASLGVLSASFTMVLKRGDPIVWGVSALSALLGGVYYPVSVLPPILKGISQLLPITYALEAMRLALLQGASWAQLLPQLQMLALFCGFLLPLSLLAFRYAVGRAKLEGSLAHY